MPSEGHMTSKERKVKKDKTDSESHAGICPLRELSPVRGNIERGNEKARKVLEKGGRWKGYTPVIWKKNLRGRVPVRKSRANKGIYEQTYQLVLPVPK